MVALLANRGGVAAGYQAYTGRGGGGSPTAGGRAADGPPAASEAAAPPTEDEVRAAEVALGRALHALHRTAGGRFVSGYLPGWSYSNVTVGGQSNTAWQPGSTQALVQAANNFARGCTGVRSTPNCCTPQGKASCNQQSGAVHCAGAIVADQLGPGKLRGVPPEWGAFASLAALVATALAPVYRQVQSCVLQMHGIRR